MKKFTLDIIQALNGYVVRDTASGDVFLVHDDQGHSLAEGIAAAIVAGRMQGSVMEAANYPSTITEVDDALFNYSKHKEERSALRSRISEMEREIAARQYQYSPYDHQRGAMRHAAMGHNKWAQNATSQIGAGLGISDYLKDIAK